MRGEKNFPTRAAVAALALGALAALGGCDPSVRDRQTFCEGASSLQVSPGGRTLIVARLFTRVTGGSGNTSDVPFDTVPVHLTAVGARPDGGPEDFGVCGGDCLADPDRARFAQKIDLATDATGVLVYTVDAGAAARGYVLIAVSDQTCLQQVGE